MQKADTEINPYRLFDCPLAPVANVSGFFAPPAQLNRVTLLVGTRSQNRPAPPAEQDRFAVNSRLLLHIVIATGKTPNIGDFHR